MSANQGPIITQVSHERVQRLADKYRDKEEIMARLQEALKDELDQVEQEDREALRECYSRRKTLDDCREDHDCEYHNKLNLCFSNEAYRASRSNPRTRDNVLQNNVLDELNRLLRLLGQ